ncbi:MAG: neutral zinc metallopeptidase [Candidatus Saccharimonas aalborgensis]|jgi:predicted metalloprotease
MARWDEIVSTGDVEDRRGVSSGLLLGGGGGLVALLLTLGLNYMGLNVSQSTVESAISTVQTMRAGQAKQTTQPEQFRGNDSYEVFTRKVLGSTNDVWSGLFSQNNSTYKKPRLVLFRQATQSGCGIATTDMGPHFCPQDQTIYLDETFFDELRTRFGADTGDVAQAYVIAHEVGHNVQSQLGVFNTKASKTRSGSIDVELQADCYAGIWAYSQAKNGIFENGEIDQAISAASAVGDDHIQKVEGVQINPETWTHGSSTERVNAFKKGYTSGQPSQCTNLQ